MKTYSFILLLICIIVAAGACIEKVADPEPDPPPAEYTLQTLISPELAGTVTPASGTFESGTELSLEATSNAGWVFTGWTGHIESDDNPLVFAINSNTSLTANFLALSSVYTIGLTAVNGDDEIGLIIGQQPETSSLEAPPPPPAGTFHVWLNRDENRYFTDIQSSGLNEVQWKVYFQGGDDPVIQFSWNIDAEQAEGSLILAFPDDSGSINMFEENSVEIDTEKTGYVIISYQFG